MEWKCAENATLPSANKTACIDAMSQIPNSDKQLLWGDRENDKSGHDFDIRLPKGYWSFTNANSTAQLKPIPLADGTCLIQPYFEEDPWKAPYKKSFLDPKSLKEAAEVLIARCLGGRYKYGIAEEMGGDNKLSMRVQPQTPPASLECGSALDEPEREKFTKCADLMLGYLPASWFNINYFDAKGIQWFAGDCLLTSKTSGGLDAAVELDLWYGFNFISAMCARQGRQGKASGYGDINQRILLSIDYPKGPGATLQLSSNGNRSEMI
ncbi:MAG: hypothetical protein Q9219_006163 [cf. Caloplaca sp. 3 TL-2023]